MRLLYHNRRPAPELEAETGAQYRPLDDILRRPSLDERLPRLLQPEMLDPDLLDPATLSDTRITARRLGQPLACACAPRRDRRPPR